MATYSVVMSQVSACQEELNQSNQKIQQLISDLESSTQRSLNEWEGSVQVTYRAKKAKWDAAAQAMGQAVAKAAAQLANINQSYNTAEQRGTQMWS